MLRRLLSAALVPRSVCTGPLAAAIALLAKLRRRLTDGVGTGDRRVVALPPSALMRRSRPLI